MIVTFWKSDIVPMVLPIRGGGPHLVNLFACRAINRHVFDLIGVQEMLKLSSALLGACALAALATSPAMAFRGGSSSGGDREPAGGAHMSSYLNPGSTGEAIGGRPRSVDIPRGYEQSYGYAPYGYAPRYRQRGW